MLLLSAAIAAGVMAGFALAAIMVKAMFGLAPFSWTVESLGSGYLV